MVLSEDQELLAKTVADFVRERLPLSRVRELRDSRDPIGFSRSLWKEMAELGWLGIPFPEAVGGADLGLAEVVLVTEACGRNLVPEPILSTVLLGGQALYWGGTQAQQSAWLPGIVAGEKIVTLAYQEPETRYDLHRVATRADAAGDGWELSGVKQQVLDAPAADALIVSARSGGGETDREGITLFLVDRRAAGLEINPQARLDSRSLGLVTLDRVEVSAADVIGEVGEGGALLDAVVDRATVGLCGEMLGLMEQAFDDTIAHLKAREQFGTVIGSFQALKHRAADLFIEIELCRSAVMAAARAVDAEPAATLGAEAAQAVSLAKALCSDAAIHVTHEAVQMFGGVGMTDEYDVGFYLKRARAAQMTFGDAAWHRDRWARLRGY